jgi:RHS repeat-associated protein
MSRLHLIILLVVFAIAISTNSYAQNNSKPTIIAPGGFEVNSYTGNLYYERNDLKIPGRIPVEITFCYNSSRRSKDWGMGRGWTFTYNMAYTQDSLGIYIDRMDGKSDFFKRSGSGYQPPLEVFDSLSEYQAHKFVLVEKGGMEYFFDDSTHRRLSRIQDRNGNTINLSYTDSLLTTLTDASGRTITFNWNNGRLAELVDHFDTPDRKVSYEYDSIGNPIKVINPLGYSKVYLYDRNSKMNGLIDERGNKISIEYNANTAVRKIISCLTSQAFSYVKSELKTFVTEDVGGEKEVTSYQYDTSGRIIVKQGNCCGYNVSFTYDAHNNISSIKKSNQEIKYKHDGLGNIVEQTDAVGNTISYSYDPVFNKLASKRNKRGYTTDYKYDAYGNLEKILKPLGVVEEFKYNEHGDLLSFTDGKNNKTDFEYNLNGYLIRITNAVRKVTQIDYDNRGNPIGITDARGNTSKFTYDELNRIKRINHPSNDSIYFEYDQANNVHSEINGLRQMTTFEYDEFNRQIKKTSPLGIVTNIKYDKSGNVILTEDGKGNETLYAYNSRNQPLIVTDALGNSEYFTYDDAGNVTSIVDKKGFTRTLQYDVLNRLLCETDPRGGKTSYAYDAGDNKVSRTDANGNTTYYEYDALNRLIGITDPLNKSIKYQYDTNGNILSERDKKGNITSYEYDRLNRLKKRINAFKQEEIYQYDENGNLKTVTNSAGTVLARKYDEMNRKVSEVNPTGDSITCTYDAIGNLITKILPGGNIEKYQYDLDNRLKIVSDALGVIVRLEYDNNGKVVKESDSLNQCTRYNYDALGRLNTITYPTNATRRFKYDQNDNQIEEINQQGYKTVYDYDHLNRLTMVLNALNFSSRYAYDLNGNLIRVTDANGNSTSYNYDALNKIRRQIYADGSIRSFTYDSDGNMETRIDNNGAKTEYTYDKLNRLIARIYPDGQTDTYEYDSLGRMKSAINRNATVRFKYDAANRLLSEDLNDRIVTYTYDIPNRIKTIKYPDGLHLEHRFDLRNRLREIRQGETVMASFQYDGNNRRIKKSYGNGITTLFKYDSLNNIKGVQVGENHLMDVEFTYDALSNVIVTERKHRSSFSESYGYDRLSQIKAISVGKYEGGAITSKYQEVFSYDPLGNRISSTEGDLSRSYSSDNLNQYKKVSENGKDVFPVYDLNGNILFDGINNYHYDIENRMVRMKNDNGDVIYEHDALGRRVSKGTDTGKTNYAFSGMHVIEERTNNSGIDYVYGSAIDEILLAKNNGSTLYYHSDPLNSVQMLTNATGQLVEQYNYGPFGTPHVYSPDDTELSVSDINNILFTGRPFDFNSHTYDFRNREMNPVHGRFTSRDPIGEEGGINLMAYVGNNPINFVDPLGLKRKSCCNFSTGTAVEYDDETHCCENSFVVQKTTVLAVNRSGGKRTGLAGGHIDLVLPGMGMIGFYGDGNNSSGNSIGLNMDGMLVSTRDEWMSTRPHYTIGPDEEIWVKDEDGNVMIYPAELSTICEVKVCPEQAQRMVSEAKFVRSTGLAFETTFNIVGHNCSTVACQILSNGGILKDGISYIDNPQHLLDQLQKKHNAKCHYGYTKMGESGQIEVIDAAGATQESFPPFWQGNRGRR